MKIIETMCDETIVIIEQFGDSNVINLRFNGKCVICLSSIDAKKLSEALERAFKKSVYYKNFKKTGECKKS